MENKEREIGKIAKSLGGRIIEVPLAEIEVSNRYREDLGDIADLALSLQTRGQLQNLVVSIQSNNGKPYRLLAGGRRFAAMSNLNWISAFALCFDRDLSELELIEIEWEENAKRKDLTWQEETKLKKRIYDLSIAIHGEKVSTAPDAPGLSLRDIAKKIEVSPATMSNDLRLASLVEKCPEAFEKCKSKKEAHKMVSIAEEQIVRAELARRISAGSEERMQRLVDSYISGKDFLVEVSRLPDCSMDFAEVDPPYSVDLAKVKQLDSPSTAFSLQAYNEVSQQDYIAFMRIVVREVYRVLNNHSWMILWFAPEPWAEIIFDEVHAAGFTTTRLTGKWIKTQAQSNQPDRYLANACEEFYYCAKGSPSIVRQGRSNIFPYATVHAQKKIHPTERPIELISDILSTFCWEGARVLVPFLGSGKTILAAESLGMKAFGYDKAIEYKDAYVLSANEMFGGVK